MTDTTYQKLVTDIEQNTYLYLQAISTKLNTEFDMNSRIESCIHEMIYKIEIKKCIRDLARYIKYCADNYDGIYDDVYTLSLGGLVETVMSHNEPYAYIATKALLDDIDGYYNHEELSPIQELYDLVQSWCAKTVIMGAEEWMKLLAVIKSHMDETIENLTCAECLREFSTLDEFRGHIIIKNSYMSPPEDYCEKEPNYDKYDDIYF